MNGRERMPFGEVQFRQSEQRNVSENWLRPISGDWPTAVCRALEWEPAVVRVVVAKASGSTPREAGTCMIVGPARVAGTIGGGHLEWEAVRLARELACADGRRRPEAGGGGNAAAAGAATASTATAGAATAGTATAGTATAGTATARTAAAGPATVGAATASATACTKRLVLATQLGQCCGGVVDLWLERFTRSDLPLLRNAAQAASAAEPVLMTSVLANGRVTRRVLNASTPAFLPPRLRSIAEALLESHPLDRAHYSDSDATLLERLDVANASLWLYGAGHVAQAIVRVLSELPITVRWIDPRAELFPRVMPANVQALHSPAPANLAGSAPRDARHLVMTHDHALDYEVCRSILKQDEFRWLGLIGSASKGARFRSRLRKDGIAEETLQRLVCPIGVEGVEGKAPAIIAISVAAQLLQTMGPSLEISDARPAATAAEPEWHLQPEALNGCRTGDCASCGSARSANA